MDEQYIKVIILSKNLTFDRSFDIAIEMCSPIGNRQTKKNQPFIDMLDFVAPNASKEKKKIINKIKEDLLKANKFELDELFEEFELLPYGINSGFDMPNTDYSDIVVVSPFLNSYTVKKLTEKAKRKILVTRKDALTNKIIDLFDEVYVVKDAVISNEFTENDKAMEQKQDIHAKMYFVSSYNGNYLYIGSANASELAFGKNVEFLLKLKYAKHKISYDTFKKDLIDDNSIFEKIDYVPENQKEQKEDELGENFKNIIWAIKNAVAEPSGDIYKIILNIKSFKSTKQAYIAPIFKEGNFKKADEGQVVFDDIKLSELCEFYIIKIDGEKTVTKIGTSGIPLDRDKSVYKKIIDKKEKFLSYVAYMLSDDYSETFFEMQENNDVNSHLLGNKIVYQSPLYEKLLAQTVSDPKRILEIEEVISKLDERVVSNEFLELYGVFKSVAKERIKSEIRAKRLSERNG